MLFSVYPYHNFSDYNLDWCIKTVKDLLTHVADMEEWRNQHEAEFQELKQFYDDIVSGNFPESMIDALKDWLSRNAIDLIGELVKMVFFGLTDSGYFGAYMPESWEDITFKTSEYDVIIPSFGEYGHLVLYY